MKITLPLILGAALFMGTGSLLNVKGSKHKSVERLGNLEQATFAGGCFWCSESTFEKVKGVVDVVSGYTGGHVENPTYGQVSSGRTGHHEAVRVYYDPEVVTFKDLMDVYWRHIDPTDPHGQFADKGSQYKTAVFYHNEEQRKIAEKSRKKLAESRKFDKPVATMIVPLINFYPAEEHHQEYYKKQSCRFNSYKKLSGREKYVEETWKSKKEH